MSKSKNRLATSLSLLHSIQTGGRTAIRSTSLSRTHRERLLKYGFLRKVIKGWYRSSRPDSYDFDDSGWLAVYWNFMSEYLEYRFGKNWCLSPEQSLLLYAGNNAVPDQLIVRSMAASNNITQLPNETSLYELKARTAVGEEVIVLNGYRLFRPELALTLVRENFLDSHPTEVETVLLSNFDEELLVKTLRTANRRTLVETLVKALSGVGKPEASKKISALNNVEIDDSHKFASLDHPYSSLPVSPYVNRIKVLWERMKDAIVRQNFMPTVGPTEIDSYLDSMEELYIRDAYHSLSIEGYQVTEGLLKAIQGGVWPSKYEIQNVSDRNALAAVGYRRSFQSVKQTVKDVLDGKNPGKAINDNLQSWFHALFSPNVEAGLLNSSSLVGYRNNQVYIRGSRHVPMNVSSLLDCMEVYFELLESETDPFTRVVLGHFFCVYIHPYFDGNGRIARFIMNVMVAAAGIPWQVIGFNVRANYFSALEQASTHGDILPFARFLHQSVNGGTREDLTESSLSNVSGAVQSCSIGELHFSGEISNSRS